jgi:hypothetical protein
MARFPRFLGALPSEGRFIGRAVRAERPHRPRRVSAPRGALWPPFWLAAVAAPAASLMAMIQAGRVSRHAGGVVWTGPTVQLTARVDLAPAVWGDFAWGEAAGLPRPLLAAGVCGSPTGI